MSLRARLADLLGDAPQSLQRLSGGSKKGAYRVTRTDGSTLIAYIWHATENYWPPTHDEHPVFADASGQELFLGAHAAMRSAGVRTVGIVAQGEGLVVVEDLVGGNLEQLIRAGSSRAEAAIRMLRGQLDVLHSVTSAGVGKVRSVLTGSERCERIAHDRALRHLAEARVHRPELPQALADVLGEALAGIEQRPQRHALIHGELGPDHVYLDRGGEPVLIDIEGLMYFDVEWEHAFMAFRFGPHYGPLRPTGLDPARLHLYTVCLRLSLIAGPLRLLEGNFPHRATMQAIAESNIQAALAYLS